MVQVVINTTALTRKLILKNLENPVDVHIDRTIKLSIFTSCQDHRLAYQQLTITPAITVGM